LQQKVQKLPTTAGESIIGNKMIVVQNCDHEATVIKSARPNPRTSSSAIDHSTKERGLHRVPHFSVSQQIAVVVEPTYLITAFGRLADIGKRALDRPQQWEDVDRQHSSTDGV